MPLSSVEFDQSELEKIKGIERGSAHFITVTEFILPYPDKITRCFGVLEGSSAGIEAASKFRDSLAHELKKGPDCCQKKCGYQVSPLFDSVEKMSLHHGDEGKHLGFEISKCLFRTTEQAAETLEKMNVVFEILFSLEEGHFSPKELRRALIGLQL